MAAAFFNVSQAADSCRWDLLRPILAVAHVKTWRMLSEEAGRFRPPLEKFPETLAAINGLLNLRRFFNPTFE